KVVSKMTTRSCSDFAGAAIVWILLVVRAVSGALGSVLAAPPECPGAKRPAGPQGTLRSRSPPRMRAAPDGVVPFRVIARIWRRVGFISPSFTQGRAKKTAPSLGAGRF